MGIPDPQVRPDRDRFVLDAASADDWEALTGRPAAPSAGLAALLSRPTPWAGTAGEGEHDDAIAPGASGIWRVVTRSSEHFFDLDRGLYLRRPAGGAAFAHDGRWCRVTRLDTPPVVGGKFFMWFDDPDTPELLEHWRQSSTIGSVERYHGPDPAHRAG
jgi:hypothetical protein